MRRLKSLWNAFQLACAITVIVCLPTGIFHDWIAAYTTDTMFWKQVLVVYGAGLIVATVAAYMIERNGK
jgi:hypothetical protein